MRSLRKWVATTALATCASACLAAPAAAEWQYTLWGMSAAEVQAASEGGARPNLDRTLDAGGLKAELTAPYQGEQVLFTAVFLFDETEKLRVVTLKPIGEAACPAIVQILSANHGMPEGRADMIHATTLRWDDTDDDNLIVYADLGPGDCTIQYSELPPTQPDGKGL